MTKKIAFRGLAFIAIFILFCVGLYAGVFGENLQGKILTFKRGLVHQTTQMVEGLDECKDSTEIFSCSADQPSYCVKNMYAEEAEPVLRDYCFECGCSGDEVCQEDGSCKNPSVSENRAPYADAGLDKVVYQGQAFRLNGFDSWDKDEWQSLDYNWEDSKGERLSDGVNPNAVFAVEGVHEVELTVSDGEDEDKDVVMIGVAEDQNWWNKKWKQRIPIVLENKNESKEDLPVFVKMYKVFGRDFDYDSINTDSIRLVKDASILTDKTNFGGEKYMIMDVDGTEGVSDYDILVFKVSLAENESKTVFVYYDNYNAGSPDYLDYYSDIVLNDNNEIENPSFEGADPNWENRPLGWGVFGDEFWGDKVKISYADVHSGVNSAFVDNPSYNYDYRDVEGMGFFQQCELELSTDYVAGGFIKHKNSGWDTVGSITQFQEGVFGVSFNDAAYPYPLEELKGYWDTIDYRIMLYGLDMHMKSTRDFDWRFAFGQFETPVDNALATINIFSMALHRIWYDDLILFEQPEVISGRVESNSTFAFDGFDLWAVNMKTVLPDTAKTNESIELDVAKNESEFFQLVVSPRVNLEDVELDVSIDGRIDVEFFDEKYLPLKEVSLPAFDKIDWPDPLPRYVVRNMAAGENHPIFVRVDVPENIDAGVYDLKIVVNPSNVRSKSLTSEVRVRDFVLPDVHNYTSTIYMTPSRIFENLNETWGNNQEVMSFFWYDKILDYFNVAEDHGVSSTYGSWPLLGAFCYDSGDKTVDFDPDKNNIGVQLKYAFDTLNMDKVEILPPVGHFDGLTHFFIDECGGELLELQPDTEEYYFALNGVLSELVDYFEVNGWEDALYFQPWAETDTAFGSKPAFYVEEMLNLISIVDEEVWDSLYTVAEHWPIDYTEEIDNSFDVYRLVRHWFFTLGEEGLKVLEDHGYKFSMGWGDQPLIDEPITKFREVGWLMWRYGLEGFTYDGWPSEWMRSYEGTSFWENPMPIFANKQNGEMYLTYSGIDSDYDAPIEESGPITSIRFELMREGLEDYEYFWLLNDLIVEAGAQGISARDARRALGRVQEMVQDFEFKRDAGLLYEIRAQVADEIESLRKRIEEGGGVFE